MRTILFILFGISTLAFGQVEQNHPFTIEFTSNDKNILLNQLVDTTESSGSTREKIELEINVSSRVESDYQIKVCLDHLTTSEDQIKLITESFRLSQSELNTPGKIKRTIELDVSKLDTLSFAKLAKISVRVDGIAFDEELHSRMLTITPKEKQVTSESLITEQEEILTKQLQAADSMDIAIVELKLCEGETICLQKFEQGKLYKKFKYSDTAQVRIKRVYIYFGDGRISRIVIIPQNIKGHFETRYAISATSFGRNRESQAFYVGPENYLDHSIKINDLISYTSFSGRRRFPPEGEITLTPKKLSDTLRIKRNPVSFFDVRTYTDPLGLNGQANGLVQTEVNARFIANTHNWRHATLFSGVRLHADWSKFDSNFDTLHFDSFNDRQQNELLSIQRQANFNFYVEAELLSFSRVHDYSFTFGHHLSLTNMTDSTSAFNRGVTPSFFTSYDMTLFATPWIQMNFKFPFYATYLHDQIFDSYDRKWDFYLSPELEVRINPGRGGNSDEKSQVSLFARAKYFDMINSRGNNFLQLQTGVSISLKDLFK